MSILGEPFLAAGQMYDVVGLYHLLGIAMENPIDRSLCRHRRYPLLCERLLDGRGTTVFAMLG